MMKTLTLLGLLPSLPSPGGRGWFEHGENRVRGWKE